MNIGIIGGADGPTSIFVASTIDWGFIIRITITVVGSLIAYLYI